MRQPYDNLFTFFRGPSSRNGDNHKAGKQLEDNATKSLLNVLDKTNREEVARPVVERISKSIDADISGISPSDWEFRTQVSPSDVAKSGRDVYLYGLSEDGGDPINWEENELELNQDLDIETSERLLDVEIRLGDRITIVGEHKFRGNTLEQKQLRRYATLLDIPEENYGVVQWREIYEELAEPAHRGSDVFTRKLTSEYREFLEYWQLSFRVSVTRFSYGENEVQISHGAEPLRVTGYAEKVPAPIGLQFRTLHDEGSNGPRVIFTPGEWKTLVADLDEEVTDALIEGDFSLFGERLDETDSDQVTLASIGSETGPRKELRAERRSKDLLSFQTWSENNANLRGERPMMGEDEFREGFGVDGDALSRDQRIGLFRDGDLNVLVQD